jgi:hypothetical protein
MLLASLQMKGYVYLLKMLQIQLQRGDVERKKLQNIPAEC